MSCENGSFSLDRTVTSEQTLPAPAPSGETKTGQKNTRQSRPHIYELDPLRATTALVVISVHALFFTLILEKTTLGTEIQNALIISVHYTREMFMFVTAFALVYVYYGRPFATDRFYKRRAIGVLIPYCVWSIIYVLLGPRQPSSGAFIKTAVIDIIDGQAAYQLYYILLTLQFYILFPLILPFVGYIKKHPWATLAISFVLELLILYADYHTLQRGVGLQNPFWHFIASYQESIVFIYQFYFILGMVAALYMNEIRDFLRRYGWWTILALLVGLAVLWIHFFVQLLYYKEPMSIATSVLQPVMIFYSLGVIAFAFWLAYRWARNVDAAGHPIGYKIWTILSDASFGIYLVHAIFLNWYMQTLVPAMPQIWPVAIRVFLTWFITALSATLLSIILMYIPGLSRLVGREGRPLSLRSLWGNARKSTQTQET